MKPSLSVLLATVTAATFATTATAMPNGAAPGKGPGAYPMDCAKAKDKARCESLNKDIEACKDKIGDEWRDCMHRPVPAAKFMPPKPRDCAKARNKERCESHTNALEACKDKTTRAEHRKCMTGQVPAPAPNKSSVSKSGPSALRPSNGTGSARGRLVSAHAQPTPSPIFKSSDCAAWPRLTAISTRPWLFSYQKAAASAASEKTRA